MKMVKYNTSIPAQDYNHPYNCIHYNNNNTYQHDCNAPRYTHTLIIISYVGA